MRTTGGDELVGVAYANDRVQAGMIRGLLEDAGIPSAEHQLGIDGPSLGYGLLNPGGGARRILVRADNSERAHAVLAETLIEGEQESLTEAAEAKEPEAQGRRKPRNYNLITAYARIWAVSVGAMALAFAVFLLLRLL